MVSVNNSATVTSHQPTYLVLLLCSSLLPRFHVCLGQSLPVQRQQSAAKMSTE